MTALDWKMPSFALLPNQANEKAGVCWRVKLKCTLNGALARRERVGQSACAFEARNNYSCLGDCVKIPEREAGRRLATKGCHTNLRKPGEFGIPNNSFLAELRVCFNAKE